MPDTRLSLPRSTAALNSEDFANTLQSELLRLPPHRLPLDAALSIGSHVQSVEQIMLLKQSLSHQGHHIKLGIFFTSVLAGCSCADDPTPLDQHNEYVEIELLLDPASGIATLAREVTGKLLES